MKAITCVVLVGLMTTTGIGIMAMDSPMELAVLPLPFDDGFENIPVGQYPSANGWFMDFHGITGVVTDQQASEGNHSFKQTSSGWARTDAVRIEMPDHLTYSVDVMVDSMSGNAVWVGFHEKISSSRSYIFNFVMFNTQRGEIYAKGDKLASSTFLQPFSTDVWYNVMVDIDFTNNNIDFYIDGVLRAGGIVPEPKATSNTFVIGSSDVACYFDDVKISGSSGPAQKVFGEYHLDEGNGDVVIDTSGNGNNGTRVGATWTDGISGKALDFDGVDDYVDLGANVLDNPSVNAQEGSIEFWICPSVDIPSTSTDPSGLFSKCTSTWGGMLMRIDHGHIELWFQQPYRSYLLMDVDRDWNAGTWYHIVGCWGAEGMKLYLNGALVAEDPYTGVWHEPEPLKVVLGGVYDNYIDSMYYYQSFQGIMDEITVLNRSLTPEEVFEKYELYLLPDPLDYLSDLRTQIEQLPDDAFLKNPDQRRNALLNKVDALEDLIIAGNLTEAIDKLQNDIRTKMDGLVDGKTNSDWIIDPDAQLALTTIIDELVAVLQPT